MGKRPVASNQRDPLLSSVKFATLGLFPLLFLTLWPFTGDYYLIKAIILWVSVSTSLVLIAWRALAHRKPDLGFDVSELAAGVFLFCAGVSFVFSANRAGAITGQYLRYEGLLTLMAYVGLFFLAKRISLRPSEKLAWLKILGGLAGLFSVYALFQTAGIEFLPWSTTQFQGRSSALFGNPLNFGGFLVLLLPVSLVFTIKYSHKSGFLWLANTAVMALALIATLSRGPLLAALITLALLVVLTWKLFDADERRKLGVFSLFFVGLVLFFVLIAQGTRLSPITRLTELGSAGTAATRLEIWKGALSMIAARPATGFGPDGFIVGFSQHRTNRYAALVAPEVTADNAHNYPLELGATLGVPALAAWIVLLMFTYVQILRPRDAARSMSLTTAALVSGILGYLVHLFFTVSDVSVTALWWFTLGLIGGQADRRFYIKPTFIMRISLLLIAVAVGILALIFSWRVAAADRHFFEAQKDLAQLQFDDSTWQYKQAVDIAPWWSAYAKQASVDMANSYQETGNAEHLQESLGFLARARAETPLDPEIHLLEAEVYLFFGTTKADLDRSALAAKTGLDLEAHSVKAYLVLAAIELRQNRKSAAYEYLEKVRHLRPSNPQLLFLTEEYGRL